MSTGIALLSAYSAGLGAALRALVGCARRVPRGVPTVPAHKPTVERAAGALLVVVGVLVATNYFIVLNSYALSLTPQWLLKRL